MNYIQSHLPFWNFQYTDRLIFHSNISKNDFLSIPFNSRSLFIESILWIFLRGTGNKKYPSCWVFGQFPKKMFPAPPPLCYMAETDKFKDNEIKFNNVIERHIKSLTNIRIAT